MLAGFAVLAFWLAPPQIERARNAEQAGDYTRMLREAQAAATACRESSDAVCEAEAVNLTATANYYQGRYDPARAAYQQAFELYHRAGDLKHQAYCLNNIGGVDFVQGRYLEAMQVYDRADSLKAGPEAEEITLANRGALYQRLGRDQAALTIYQELKRRNGSFSPSEQAQLLTNLGALIRRLGDPVKARATYEEALRLYRSERNSDREIGTLKNLGILEALEFNNIAAARRRFDEALQRAVSTANRREEMQARLYLAECDSRDARWAEATRGWNIVLTLARAAKAPEEEWKAEYGLGRAALQQGNTDESQHRFAHAVEIIESIRTALGRGILRRDFLADKRAPYDAVVALLLAQPAQDLDAILNWMERARARTLQETLSPEPLSIATLQKRIDAGTTLDVLWKHPSTKVVIALRITRQSAQIGGSVNSRRVVVVPDGAPGTGDGASWYIPTARYLLRESPPSRWRWPWETQVLAIVAGEKDATVTLLPGDETLAALPGARKEIGSISVQFNTRVVTEPSTLAPTIPVLHFAAHAIADREDPTRSRIILPDGYLFATDIARMNLQSVSLVTLSACETEAGVDIPGEGPQSLARAFLAAGAGATVASLWKVEDQATAEFMRLFYSGLAQGLGKAEALQKAKLALRGSETRFADPRHWAAFVLTGDGRSPLPHQISWVNLLCVLAIMLAAAAVFQHRLNRR